MSGHGASWADDEGRDLASLGPLLFRAGLGVGVAGLVLGAAVSAFDLRTMGLAYLTGFSYWLSLSLGALFFVIIQHLTRAGWSVTVRRIAELMAANTATMGVLLIPVLIGIPVIYHHWVHAGDDPLLAHKAPWLNVSAFAIRLIAYTGIWIAMGIWSLRHSLAQDHDGDAYHTDVQQRYAGGLMVVYALSVNFAAIDLLMSLAPHWYSTIYGVYYFAGAMLGFFAFTAVAVRLLQARGVLRESVTVEHYHDLGKWLFGFVFFWGYIAFSQYMLIWYGALPEETAWLARRGATTNPETVTPWAWVSLALLFGHLLIPFAGLLSRWTKRGLGALTFFAAWLLVFHFVDIAWLVMPERREPAGMIGQLAAALLCTVGVGGFWMAGLAWLAADRSLVPVKDPRLGESLAFENI